MTDTDSNVDRESGDRSERRGSGPRTTEDPRTDGGAPDTEGSRERTTRDPNPGGRGKWISALIALLGLWMMVEAVAFDLVAAQFWNDVVAGVLLLAVGAYNYSRRSDERLGSMGAALLVALIGLWLVASPMMFGADAGITEAVNDAGFWNDVAVGLVALVLGAYSAYTIRDHRRDTRTAMG